MVKWIVFPSSKEVPLQHKKKEETRCRKPVNNKKTGGAGKARMDYYSIIILPLYIYIKHTRTHIHGDIHEHTHN